MATANLQERKYSCLGYKALKDRGGKIEMKKERCIEDTMKELHGDMKRRSRRTQTGSERR